MVTPKKQKTTRKTSGKSPVRKKKTRKAHVPVPDATTKDVELIGKMTTSPTVKTSKGHERRYNPRIAFKTQADLQFKDGTQNGLITRDLSINGTFVLNMKDKQVGDECEVTLHCDLVLKMKGEVVRVEEKGSAIQFFDQDLDNFHHLKNVVYINAVDHEEADIFDDKMVDELPMKKLEDNGLLDDIFCDEDDDLYDNNGLEEYLDSDY
ncbi:MAG: PilZ domain-containing protein [Thermodesulfobacteriota bacterium]|nr:PilZ domain-containing protein [Thermodesulfobacteriota bacterium]